MCQARFPAPGTGSDDFWLGLSEPVKNDAVVPPTSDAVPEPTLGFVVSELKSHWVIIAARVGEIATAIPTKKRTALLIVTLCSLDQNGRMDLEASASPFACKVVPLHHPEGAALSKAALLTRSPGLRHDREIGRISNSWQEKFCRNDRYFVAMTDFTSRRPIKIPDRR